MPEQSAPNNVPSDRVVKLLVTNFDEHDAILQNGDEVTFVTAMMAVDKPYVFRWLGGWRVAVKRADGSMDVYAVPKQYGPVLRRLSGLFRRIGTSA